MAACAAALNVSWQLRNLTVDAEQLSRDLCVDNEELKESRFVLDGMAAGASQAQYLVGGAVSQPILRPSA